MSIVLVGCTTSALYTRHTFTHSTDSVHVSTSPKDTKFNVNCLTSLHLYYEYTYSRDSRVLLIHSARARCSTPSPMALPLRLQTRQQWHWSQANMTHWPLGGGTYCKDLRDVLVCNPSAMALAPCEVALHHPRLFTVKGIIVALRQATLIDYAALLLASHCTRSLLTCCVCEVVHVGLYIKIRLWT